MRGAAASYRNNEYKRESRIASRGRQWPTGRQGKAEWTREAEQLGRDWSFANRELELRRTKPKEVVKCRWSWSRGRSPADSFLRESRAEAEAEGRSSIAAGAGAVGGRRLG
ncbi:unnamed protein product [Linum trigynum]|uniref:Uncharacterized protein n=1 Tax=Linum trigynum TaxID=586398 RepID=A0AAV2FNE4_9ROSI